MIVYSIFLYSSDLLYLGFQGYTNSVSGTASASTQLSDVYTQMMMIMTIEIAQK